MKQRAYLIYECDHGWCYEPTTVSTVRESPAMTRAFSNVFELLDHLRHHVDTKAREATRIGELMDLVRTAP